MTNELIERKKKTNVFSIGRKNLVMILSVLLIGGAVALNWILFSTPTQQTDNPTTDQVPAGDNTATTPDADSGVVSDYFAQMALERQKARDEAMEVLQNVVDSAQAEQTAKDEAYNKINQIADTIQQEANIETLIIAKGFEDCVAVISGDRVSVIVKTDGLLENEVVQIQEIVYLQCGVLPTNVQIIEKA